MRIGAYQFAISGDVNENYKEMYEKAVNPELMYIQRINELEKILKKKNSLSVNNEIYRQINQ